MCATCGDKGVIRLNFQEGDEYGLCLCRAGEDMRRGRLWELWCAREGVDPAKVSRLEDVLTKEELAARGFQELSGTDALAAVVEAAKRRSHARSL